MSTIDFSTLALPGAIAIKKELVVVPSHDMIIRSSCLLQTHSPHNQGVTLPFFLFLVHVSTACARAQFTLSYMLYVP